MRRGLSGRIWWTSFWRKVGVVGEDAFTGYYSRRRKEQLLSRPWEGRIPARGGDLLDLDLDQLVRDVDGVVHLAGEPGVRRSWGGAFGGTWKTTSSARSACSRPPGGTAAVRVRVLIFRIRVRPRASGR